MVRRAAPFISQAHVQAALDAFIYSSKKRESNPLADLLLVDELLTHPDWPNGEGMRDLALGQILVSMITAELQSQRRKFELPEPTCDMTIEQAKQAVSVDGQTQSQELMGWSALFYRYVCADFNFGSEQLSEALHVDARTVGRYQVHAAHRLTDQLILAETEARGRQRYRRLVAELPSSAPVKLLGREAELALAGDCLAGEPPCHLLVSGQSGSGKTTFVQEFLRGQIEADWVDHLVWIERPISIQAVRDQLVERLLPERSSIKLREYVSMYHVALALDDIRELPLDELHALLQDLDAALVCVINPIYEPLPRKHCHIPLDDLEKNDVHSLVRATLPAGERDLADDFTPEIWAAVGGNPLAVTLLTQNLPYYDKAASPEIPVLERIYSAIYESLSPALKKTWLALSLTPPGTVAINTIVALWPEQIRAADFGDLARAHLIQRTAAGTGSDVYVLSAAARRFLRSRPDQTQAHDLLAALDANLAVNAGLCLETVEYLLADDSCLLTDGYRRRWLQLSWREGLRRGHYARWRGLLENVFDDSIETDLMLPYGVCLRRFNQWDDALAVLRTAVERAGAAGDFALQARILVELAVLFRYRGQYEVSAALLKQTERAALNFGDAELETLWRLEQAQLCIDQKIPAEAESFIAPLPDTARVLALRSEIALLSGDYEGARVFAERMTPNSDHAIEARLQNLLGRSLEEQERFEDAYRHYSAAVLHGEQANDAFALARAQCNVGALALRLKRPVEAVTVLAEAEKTLSKLGDEVALTAARHNLQLARIRISR